MEEKARRDKEKKKQRGVYPHLNWAPLFVLFLTFPKFQYVSQSRGNIGSWLRLVKPGFNGSGYEMLASRQPEIASSSIHNQRVQAYGISNTQFTLRPVASETEPRG